MLCKRKSGHKSYLVMHLGILNLKFADSRTYFVFLFHS